MDLTRYKNSLISNKAANLLASYFSTFPVTPICTIVQHV